MPEPTRKLKTGDVFCMSPELVELLYGLSPDDSLVKKIESIPACADEFIGVAGHTTQAGELKLNQCFRTAEGLHGTRLFDVLKHCADKHQ